MRSSKHRTQISLEYWQYEKLCEISHKTRKSLSRIVRDLIAERYSDQTGKAKSDPLMAIIGIGAGDGSPVAREHDRFLYGKRK